MPLKKACILASRANPSGCQIPLGLALSADSLQDISGSLVGGSGMSLKISLEMLFLICGALVINIPHT